MPRTPRAPRASDSESARLLLALAESGEVSAAAERVGLTPTAARRRLTELARGLDPTAGQGALPGAGGGTRAAAAPPSAAGSAPARAAGRKGPSVRVFCDGAARGNPGPAGAGAVVQDASGEVLARLGKYLGHATNNVAEYQGLLLGLRHAGAMGASEVQVVSDSELMVKQLQGRYKVKAAHLKPLYDEAVAALKRFDAWSVRHVLRGENSAADQMANRAVDERLDD